MYVFRKSYLLPLFATGDELLVSFLFINKHVPRHSCCGFFYYMNIAAVWQKQQQCGVNSVGVKVAAFTADKLQICLCFHLKPVVFPSPSVCYITQAPAIK